MHTLYTRLAAALGRCLDDAALASAHGLAGQSRAVSDFVPERIWAGLDVLYRSLLESPS